MSYNACYMISILVGSYTTLRFPVGPSFGQAGVWALPMHGRALLTLQAEVSVKSEVPSGSPQFDCDGRLWG